MTLERFLSRDARNMRPSAIRAFARLINDPGVISFAGGVPNPESFPAERLAEIAQGVLRQRREVALQYGPTRGMPRLLEAVAKICRSRKIEINASQLMLTTGSQQGLDLIAHALLDPGDVVLVELPAYIGGTSSLIGRSARLQGVMQDDAGIVPDSLEAVAAAARPKLLYTIPNFQNPSGRLMAQQRRRQALEIAERYDFLILEDDPYGELLYTGGLDTTPIAAQDRSDRVLYLGSFSKVLAPGLRCGWIAGPPSIMERLEIVKQAADLCSGMLDQAIIDEFIAAGELPAQIQRVRDFYRGKRATLLESLGENFAGRARWTNADGGLFTFVTLDDHSIDTGTFVEPAVRNGVAYIPGSPFFVDGSGANTMRLTFAKESDERIREGVRRLAAVLPP